MRLIDSDALEKAIYRWMPKDQETWMDSDIPPIENLVVSIMMTIQEQPTVDRWIPVSERLPAWGEKVLICNQRGEFALGRITQSDEGDVWDVGTWWIELKEYDAWMPLPEPYRGEE